MDYSIALGNGMNPSTPLNMGVKLMYVFALPNIQKQLCTKICFSGLDVSECSYREFLQCAINNALFELLFVMLNQKLDFCFFDSFIYNKN